MSKSNAFENAILLLIFNNDAIALIGDASGLQPSGGDGSLYISLHTADPGEAGTQTTNEIAYTSYARVAVARTTGGWTVSSNAVTNAATVTFPTGSGGSGTATHFGIGASSSGTGLLLYKGALAGSLVCGSGVTPTFPAGDIDVTED
jgi:hypothetical protein